MMKMTLVTACAALALAAPSIAQDKPKQTTVVIKDDTTPKVKQGAHAVSDASVTTAVNTRLMKDKVAHEKAIIVHTKDGVVTLTGTVPTEADKTRIAGIAQRTTGVKSVENELTVSAVGTGGHGTEKDTKVVIKDDTTPAVKKGAKAVTDTSVTTEVKTRLMGDDAGRANSIEVHTTGGVVTIAGTVPTEADKARIGDLVSRTTGVKRVVNHLTVK